MRRRDSRGRRPARRGGAPIRVLAYTDSFDYGGADQSLATLLRGLGPDVEAMVMGPEAEIVERVAEQGGCAEAIVIPRVRNKRDLAGIARHVREARSLGPDVLHANLRSPWSSQYGLLAGLITRTATVAVQHSCRPPRVRRQASFNRLILSRVDAHVAVSRFAARGVERMLGFEQGTIEVIPNGVPDRPVEPVARPAAGPVIGGAGRLSVEKGFESVVRALPALPGVTAVLVGDGPEREAIERLAAELGVADRLVVTGWREDARGWLAMLDVVVVPSLARSLESQPLVAIEAMLAERPVVATRVGGVPDVVEDGVTGILVEPGHHDALAGAVRGLLDEPDRRKAMGRAGRERARREFAIEGMVESFEALYAALCERDRASGTRRGAGSAARLASAAASRTRARITSERVGVAVLYHRVEGPGGRREDLIAPTIGTDLFAAEVRHLSRRYRLVPASQLLGAVRSRRRGDPIPAAITFDDDSPSHVRHAAPILAGINAPATFFLNGASLDGTPHEYWWERLDRARARRLISIEELRAVVPPGPGRPPADSRDLREIAADVELMPAADREAFCAELGRLVGPAPERLAMPAREVRELTVAGFEVGFHTLGHPNLTQLDDPDLASALREGRDRLAEAAGTPVDTVAYPGGKWDRRVADAARAAGFRAGFTTEQVAIEPGADPLALGRIDPGWCAIVGQFALAVVRVLSRRTDGPAGGA